MCSLYGIEKEIVNGDGVVGSDLVNGFPFSSPVRAFIGQIL